MSGHRDALLILVLEAQQGGGSDSLLARARALLATVASATKYLKLEPNIAGMGINLGKIIEDAAKNHGKEPRQTPGSSE
jgi:hypothetical protein